LRIFHQYSLHIPKLTNMVVFTRPTAGGSAAWPLPLCSYYFNRKIETRAKRLLA
jgi:hypothetical protein